MELEIDQGSHVSFRNSFGKDVYRKWDELSGEAKEEIKNTIIKAEKLIRQSANTLWSQAKSQEIGGDGKV